MADVGGALAYLGRFTGLLMVIASAVIILGALGILDHWNGRHFEISGLLALAGAAVALVANALLLVVTVRDGVESVGYAVLWSLLIGSSGVACYVIYHSGVHIPAPKKIAVAGSLTAAAAIANLGYTQLDQPYHEEPRPTLDTRFGEPAVSADRGRISIPVTIQFENPSNVGLYILGDAFTIWGRRQADRITDNVTSEWRSGAHDEQDQISRLAVVKSDPIEVGRWGTFGSWVDPKGSTAVTKIVELPFGTPYDQLGISADLATARTDRMSLDWRFGNEPHFSWLDSRSSACADGADCVRYRGRIWENNSIAQHTRHPRHLTLWWRFNSTVGADVTTDISRADEVDRVVGPEESERLKRRYGLVIVSSSWNFRSLLDVKR
ncbi:hypothetical protein [Parafrankia sp. EUN1f]|uniref:hypothetical protein n=1 Tax=Parafrankia sp. EUN1f TaxID=102897 RepID=UPI001E517DD0|nr:hypothetical protein [Parafrankia sp. EUN1f]